MILDHPTPPLPKKMPHLSGSLHLHGPRGMCFHRSAGFVLDVPGSILCFATFRAATAEEIEKIGPLASRVPFIHCWAEFRGLVWAPSLLETWGGRLHTMPREPYYEINGAKDFRQLTRPALLRLSREHGLAQHLTKHVDVKNGGSFGGLLLDAAGIAWKPTPEGGTIPA